MAANEDVEQMAKHLEPDSVVIFDGLNCFPGVKDAGCTHQVIITGGGPDSVKITESKWVNTMIGTIKNAIRCTHHSISEKHVSRYLAEFCYRFNRCFQLDQMIAQLAYVAVRTMPVPQRLLS